eukprot:Gb_38030 [translate_table: standard]
MPLVGAQVENGLKGGEVVICDVESPLNILNGCPLEALNFSCVAITDNFVYNGFLCMLNGVRKRFNILSGLESSKVVSPLSPGSSSSNRHHNGFSSWSSNIILQSPSNIDFEKSFLVPVTRTMMESSCDFFLRFANKFLMGLFLMTFYVGTSHSASFTRLCSPHLRLQDSSTISFQLAPTPSSSEKSFQREISGLMDSPSVELVAASGDPLAMGGLVVNHHYYHR